MVSYLHGISRESQPSQPHARQCSYSFRSSLTRERRLRGTVITLISINVAYCNERISSNRNLAHL